MTKGLVRVALTALIYLSACFTTVVYADAESVLPDFYSEPGFHKWRDEVSTQTERIDPFNGSLSISNIDIVVPGNGGLDIKIQRHYTSNIWLSRANLFSNGPIPSLLLPESPMGVGWSMHFGRIVKSARDDGTPDGICNLGNPDESKDNAVLELPDGSQHILYNNIYDWGGTFITKSFWMANCYGASEGLLLYSPNGLKYTMNHLVASFDETTYTTRLNRAWYPTKIEDGNGNFLTFEYSSINKGSHALVSKITASDGREVTFTYTGDSLTSITAVDAITPENSQTWTYEYTSTGGAGHSVLSRVVRPDGLAWQYDYNPYASATAHSALRQITHPYGSTSSFEYDYVDFMGPLALDPAAPADRYYSPVVTSKVVGGRSMTPGTWTYEYFPGQDFDIEIVTDVYGNEIALPNDRTVVTFPGGRHIYKHYGSQRLGVFSRRDRGADIWKTGRLVEKEVQTESATPGQYITDQTEKYVWDFGVVLSNEVDRAIGLNYTDYYTYHTYLAEQIIVRDGTSYVTTYDYGSTETGWAIQAKSKTETGQANTPYQFSKYAELQWYPIPGDRVLDGTPEGRLITLENSTYYFGLLKDEFVPTYLAQNPALSKYSWYDYTKGNKYQEQNYSLGKYYQHDPQGNVSTVTDHIGSVTYLEQYFRGIPQSETHPVSAGVNATISRSVNGLGTVASETDANEFVSSYSYDSMSRLSGIIPPRPGSSAVSILYDVLAYSQVIERGNYLRTTYYDGLGRPECVMTSDTATGENLYKITRYDSLGRSIFTSDLMTGLCPMWFEDVAGINGIAVTYDSLGRVLSQTNTVDQTSVSYVYQANNEVVVTDENQGVTLYRYRSFGNPDNQGERVLTYVRDPEGNETFIDRNLRGQMKSVIQTDGTTSYTRTYTYMDEIYPEMTSPGHIQFLASINEPEIGRTNFGRDGLGNMTSKEILSAGVETTYRYDRQSRLTKKLYQGLLEADVSYSYDLNGNLTGITKGDISQTYIYDESNNLKNEIINVGADTYEVGYGYNDLDFVTRLDLPSGNGIDFNPNAFGRSSSIGSYANNIDYYPAGQVKSITLGNGITTNYGLDSRNRIQSIVAPNAIDHTYSYDNKSNVTSITNGILGNYSLSLTYDLADRLRTANGNWGTGSFDYDGVGNIKSASYGRENVTYTYGVNNLLTGVNGGKSRDFTYTYDGFGNVTANGINTFSWDEEGNLTGVDGTNNKYVYDGNNRRTLVIETDKTTTSIYSKNGQLIGEYTPKAGNWRISKEYIYLNNQLIASNTDDPDSDNDGLADSWEEQYFGVGYLAWGGSDDPDGDGITNQQEYLEGTNPTTPEAAPVTAPVLTAVGEDAQVVLSWTAVTSTACYNIYWYTSTDATVRNAGCLSGTSYTHTGLVNDIEHFYFISATNNTGESAASATISALPSARIWQPAELLSDRARTNAVARNRNSIIVAAYETADGIAFKTRYPSMGWTTPEYISESGTSPSVAIDDAGNVLVSWLQHDGARNNLWAAYYNSVTDAWGAPELVEVYNGGHVVDDIYDYGNVFEHRVVMSANGNAAIVWQQESISRFPDSTRGTIENIKIWARRYIPGIGFDSAYMLDEDFVGDSGTPSAAIDNSGNMTAVWYRRTNSSVIAGSIFHKHVMTSGLSADGTPPGAPIVIDTNPDEAGYDVDEQPQFVMDANGNGLAIWAQNNTSRTNLFSRAFNVQSGWAPTLESVESKTTVPLSYKLSMNENGTVVAAFRQSGAIWTNFYNPGASWSGPATTGIDGYPQNLSLANKGDVVMVWTTGTGNWFYEAWSSRYNSSIGSWEAAELIWPTSPAQSASFSGDAATGNVIQSWQHVDGTTLIDGASVRRYESRQLSAPSPLVPIANAGVDQDVSEGDAVTLDGSASSDTDGIIASVQWQQLTGTLVTLAADDSLKPRFNAPYVLAAGDILSFSLTVTDNGGNTANTTVSVTVQDDPLNNAAPVANAGNGFMVRPGQIATLDGSQSTDSDGAILNYQWLWISGTPVAINNATSAQATFTAPIIYTEESLTFNLSITDDDGATAVDTVVVTVKPDPTLDEDGDGLPDLWEYQYFGDLSQDPDGINGDWDQDGVSNWDEYLNNTDPTAPEPAPIAAPTMYVAPGDGSATLTWARMPGAGQYDIYWGTSPGVTTSNGTLLTDVTSPFTHTGLLNGLNYHYIVVASNNTGSSPASSEVVVSPAARNWQPPVVMTQSTVNNSFYPGVDMDASGNALTAWTNYPDSFSLYSIFGRRYDVSSGWQAIDMLETDDVQHQWGDPAVSMNMAGDGAAAWNNDNSEVWSNAYQFTLGQWSGANLVSGGYSGSSEPVIGLGADGTSLMVWQQTDSATYEDRLLFSSHTISTGWHPPLILEDYGTTPVRQQLVVNDDGDAVLTWLEANINGSVTVPGRIKARWYNRHTGQWGDPLLVADNLSVNTYTDLQVTMDKDGNGVIWWQDVNGVYYSYGRAHLTWGVYRQAIQTTNSVIYFGVATAPDGLATIAWQERDSRGNLYMWAARLDPVTGISEPVQLQQGGIFRGEPVVTIDSEGNGVAAWVLEGRKSTLVYTSHYQNGVWSAPTTVSTTGIASDVQMATDPAGNLMLLWNQNNGTTYDLMASRYGKP